METNKKSNFIIIILAILVIALGGYIAFDKFLNKNNANSNENIDNNNVSNEVINNEKENGECPLTVFNNSHVSNPTSETILSFNSINNNNFPFSV